MPEALDTLIYALGCVALGVLVLLAIGIPVAFLICRRFVRDEQRAAELDTYSEVSETK